MPLFPQHPIVLHWPEPQLPLFELPDPDGMPSDVQHHQGLQVSHPELDALPPKVADHRHRGLALPLFVEHTVVHNLQLWQTLPRQV